MPEHETITTVIWNAAHAHHAHSILSSSRGQTVDATRIGWDYTRSQTTDKTYSISNLGMTTFLSGQIKLCHYIMFGVMVSPANVT